MKLHALMIAVALAAGGAAFAQAPAPGNLNTAPGNAAATAPTSSAAADMGTADKSPVTKVHKKTVKKAHAHKHHASNARHRAHEHHAKAPHHEHHAKAGHHEHHAKAGHHAHHAMHAGARMHHRDHASAMGAGPASPSVNLNDGARQARMDQAYANWRALQGRR